MRIGLIAAAIFNALLLVATNSHAVGGGGGIGGGGGGGGGGGTPAVGGRYPIGAPPSNEATEAYQFRSRMSVDPQCQELAQAADQAFMADGVQTEQKVQQLNGIRARAQSLGCLQ